MMRYKLVIAEKPSVAQSLAAVIGATARKDGYLGGERLACQLVRGPSGRSCGCRQL